VSPGMAAAWRRGFKEGVMPRVVLRVRAVIHRRVHTFHGYFVSRAVPRCLASLRMWRLDRQTELQRRTF